MQVKDHSHSNKDLHLGSFAARVEDMQEGYRRAYLVDTAGKQLKPASLFLRIEKKEVASELLHGTLHVEAVEARDLPDTDLICGDLTDPFLEVFLGPSSLLKTSVKENCLEPVWNEKFSIEVCHPCQEIKVEVKDKENIGCELVGYFTVPASDLLTGDTVGGWFDLIVSKDGKTQGQVNINLKFVPVSGRERSDLTEETYFPVTEDCGLTLYQDAETPQLEIFRGLTDSQGRLGHLDVEDCSEELLRP